LAESSIAGDMLLLEGRESNCRGSSIKPAFLVFVNGLSKSSLDDMKK